MAATTGAAARRAEIRRTHFSDLDLWSGEQETGWGAVPRTISLIMSLLDSKEISGNKSPSTVYLELLTRHRSDGILEMAKESEHAFAAGYEGTRAIRTWTERMEMLEKNHFIVTKQVGNDRFGYVALVHPVLAVQKLHEEGRVPAVWMSAYLRRKLETKEPTHEKRMEEQEAAAKVVPIAIVSKPKLPVPPNGKAKRKA